ncbi:PKD domain-containing protein [Candidatus Bipolaricaulota bacterium]|nr:PKD domain-containing protein [Candidatus Bipolaricaulota bacterium]
MARRLFIGILFIAVLSSFAMAQEAPVLVQPRETGYSPAQLSLLESEISHLQARLNDFNLGSKKKLGVGGWTAEKFAAYTAGNLERLGYQVAILSRQMTNGTTKVWVAVRIDLGGAVAWIPVEPVPNPDIFQPDLGDIPLVASLVYDSEYMTYTTIVTLPANIPPTAAIRAPMSDVVETESSAWFGNSSVDPDGEIVLFQWTFGNDVQRTSYNISAWYTFNPGGMDYPVSLTVTDSRGAQATTTTTVYVLTLQEKADKNCGCGH